MAVSTVAGSTAEGNNVGIDLGGDIGNDPGDNVGDEVDNIYGSVIDADDGGFDD